MLSFFVLLIEELVRVLPCRKQPSLTLTTITTTATTQQQQHFREITPHYTTTVIFHSHARTKAKRTSYCEKERVAESRPFRACCPVEDECRRRAECAAACKFAVADELSSVFRSPAGCVCGVFAQTTCCGGHRVRRAPQASEV